MTRDARLYAPAAARNRQPITDVLRRVLPPRGVVLEIASGSGEHIVHFAQSLGGGLTFQPSDPNAEARASIDAWVATLELPQVQPALDLEAAAPTWPISRADAVICINMIHIAPWDATLGLLRGAARVLTPIGKLILYGPFRRHGAHTAPSNAAFDADLQVRDTAWGVRDLETVAEVAAELGFAAPIIHEMPANNLLVVFGQSIASP
jgi:SAM-dependent methyltransferase